MIILQTFLKKRHKTSDYFDDLGIQKSSDTFDSLIPKVIPKDKEAFFKLRDSLDTYVLFRHEKITATFDSEKLHVKIDGVLPFVDFCTKSEFTC